MSEAVTNANRTITGAVGGRAEAAAARSTGAPASDRLLAREATHTTGLYSPRAALVSGSGATVTDADGRVYLDCMAGIGVASIGHANERLAAALAAQANKLVVCPQGLGNDVRADFLELLFEFVQPPLTRAFLSNSGAEANEAAIRWARAATGRRRLVAAKRGFAGRTAGALRLTWDPRHRSHLVDDDGDVEFVSYNDVEGLAAAITDEVALVLLEPVQGEGGVHPATAEFLTAARVHSRQHGSLLAFDEIQSGVGRSGTFLASEPAGVTPDIVTLAKGLGGGVPIGATLLTDEVAAALPRGSYGTTFGGNPLAAVAGLTVLTEIRERGLMERARVLGARLRDGLIAIDSPLVREVRGVGLMIGMEMRQRAAPVIAGLLERGLLTVAAGPNVVRFLPPLVITAAEVDEVVRIVRDELLSA